MMATERPEKSSLRVDMGVGNGEWEVGSVEGVVGSLNSSLNSQLSTLNAHHDTASAGDWQGTGEADLIRLQRLDWSILDRQNVVKLGRIFAVEYLFGRLRCSSLAKQLEQQ